jgi:hypothetical protein
MGINKLLQNGEIGPPQLNISLQEVMDALRGKREASDCVIDLTDGDSGVIARAGASFDDGFTTGCDPTHSKTR